MIEEYLSQYLHHNRVGSIMSVIDGLTRMGMDECGQTVESEIMSGAEGGVDEVLSNIEGCVETALVGAFVQFGISIDYRHESIQEHMELLNFLMTWGTPDGYDKSSVNLNGESLRELGVNDTDVLLEFWARVTGKPEFAYVDWVLTVEHYLIHVLEGMLADTEEPEPEEEANLVTFSILNPFRGYAAHYPDTLAVKYVKLGGALALPLDRLLLNVAPTLNAGLPDDFALDLVGFGLLSTTPREELAMQLATFIEQTYGPTSEARRCIATLNKILTNVLGMNNHG